MRPSCWLAQARTATRLGKNVLESALVHRSSNEVRQTTRHDGALSNWPISVKDNFCTLEMPTSCSSRMLKDYVSPFEATSVQLLRKAGANIIGKTNCDEFGMGSSNLYSTYGPVLNPESWQGEERVAGGSSGGAAATVACGQCRVSMASDTGGSIRTPAAYCGVYGLKPSYGLISRWGLVSYADSLDTVGLLGLDSRDIKSVFQIVSQHDPEDSTSIPSIIRDKAKEVSAQVVRRLHDGNQPLSGLRVGVPAEFFPKELNKDVLPALRDVLGRLKSMGANIVSVTLPSTQYALSAYYVLASAEASSNLAKYDGIRFGHRAEASEPITTSTNSPSPFQAHISKTRSEGFGAEVQKRLLLGTYSLTSDFFDNYFLQAQKVRRLIRQDFDQAFRIPNVLIDAENTKSWKEGVDVLITPSTVDIAPTLKEAANMGIQAYTQDLLTVPASLAGLPAMSIPSVRARDMPVGVTLTSQWGCEEVLFEMAKNLSS